MHKTKNLEYYNVKSETFPVSADVVTENAFSQTGCVMASMTAKTNQTRETAHIQTAPMAE